MLHNGTERFTLTDYDKEEEDSKTGSQGHINAITAIGFSNKTKNNDDTKKEKIGKFGLGFKSVYNYTDNPHIYDDPYCFKMDRDFIPELLEDRSLMQKGRTVIVLPFDKEGSDLDSIIQSLKGELTGMSKVVPQLFFLTSSTRHLHKSPTGFVHHHYTYRARPIPLFAYKHDAKIRKTRLAPPCVTYKTT